MSAEERIRYLRRAASRAEGEGNLRVARVLRLMAADARPDEDGVYAVVRIPSGLEE